MICTAKQLKDKVRNLSKGDNDIAKALIRTFMMERFLERVSLEKLYKIYKMPQSKSLIFCKLNSRGFATLSGYKELADFLSEELKSEENQCKIKCGNKE